MQSLGYWTPLIKNTSLLHNTSTVSTEHGHFKTFFGRGTDTAHTLIIINCIIVIYIGYIIQRSPEKTINNIFMHSFFHILYVFTFSVLEPLVILTIFHMM